MLTFCIFIRLDVENSLERISKLKTNSLTTFFNFTLVDGTDRG